MLQVDLPAAFAIGQVCAIMAKDALKKEKDLFANKFLGPVNLFFSCGFAPGGLFLLIGWPAWECMYVTKWFEQPYDRPLCAVAYILFFIVMVLLGNLGFILGHYWYRGNKDKWVIAGSIIGVALALLPFLIKWGIWWDIGTYQEVALNKGGYSFWKPPFFYGWLGIMSYMVVTFAGILLWLRKQSTL